MRQPTCCCVRESHSATPELLPAKEKETVEGSVWAYEAGKVLVFEATHLLLCVSPTAPRLSCCLHKRVVRLKDQRLKTQGEGWHRRRKVTI